jgi:hypothetical protein
MYKQIKRKSLFRQRGYKDFISEMMNENMQIIVTIMEATKKTPLFKAGECQRYAQIIEAHNNTGASLPGKGG